MGAGGFTADAERAVVLEESWFDPLVEFLEIVTEVRELGNPAATRRSWRVHGPDANGSYGGLQGLGGLEAVYSHGAAAVASGSWSAVIDDYYGHVIATVEGTAEESSVVWQRTRSLGYGPAPDSPVWTLSEGASLEQATAWRGRRQDITGFYWMGARYYESSSGRFLSPDPYGHAASLSLYDYAGGDPINFVDPTGRLQVEQNSQGATQDSGFRFYEHPGVGQGGNNALVNVVEAERSRSMAMGAFFTKSVQFMEGDMAEMTPSVLDKKYGREYRNSYILMYSNDDPMFERWAKGGRSTIEGNGMTPAGTFFKDFDSKLDVVALIPVSSFEDIDEAQSFFRDVRYIGSFGHGRVGSIWYNDIYQFGIVKPKNPKALSRGPESFLSWSFAADWTSIELYHCHSCEPSPSGNPGQGGFGKVVETKARQMGYPNVGVYGIDGGWGRWFDFGERLPSPGRGNDPSNPRLKLPVEIFKNEQGLREWGNVFRNKRFY